MYTYTWYQWLLIFYTYCFFGWIFESTSVSYTHLHDHLIHTPAPLSIVIRLL